MIYLIGDLHLNHNKEFLYGGRGFSSIEEHNEAIVQNWNSVVNDDDIVYSLGDEMLGNNEVALSYFNRLKGCIYLVIGNHTTPNREAIFRQMINYPPQEQIGRIIAVEYGYRLTYKKTEYWLSHYPMLVANGEDPKPVFNIHSHTHATKIHSNLPHCLCVSADAIGLTPISLEELHANRFNSER